jgi:hypothetical protein
LPAISIHLLTVTAPDLGYSHPSAAPWATTTSWIFVAPASSHSIQICPWPHHLRQTSETKTDFLTHKHKTGLQWQLSKSEHLSAAGSWG